MLQPERPHNRLSAELSITTIFLNKEGYKNIF